MKRNGICGSRLLAFVALFASFFVATNFAYAADDVPTGAFIVRPAKVELDIKPGEEQTTILTLLNGTALPLSVSTSYEDIAGNAQQSPNDEPVKLLGTTGSSYSLKDLFFAHDTSVDMLSGEEVQIPITVKIPKDAEAGGRYGSVILTFKPILSPGSPQNANVAIESRLATLFFVRILGDAKESGQLVKFGIFNDVKTVLKPTLAEPLRFQVTYENTGTVHLNPYGLLTLSPLVGKPVSVVIDPQAVLPGATRMREVDIRDEFSVGYYRAHLNLNRGYGNNVDVADVSFWIVPGTAGIIMTIVGLVLFAWLIRRSLSLSKHSVK
ncbi:MAG: hypothetical protein UY04_C0011G0019 [Parcubacteria group bacterium GW2011_GWA2_47_7]|nr:MAG: hypothetical protein UY04_C0011G0019 [Parcubacteria group bacterium GW2011_GWA2_47_7]